MSIAILILTHDLVGTSLLKAAERTLGALPENIEALPICNDCELEKILLQVQIVLAKLQQNSAGILILTDLYGSTPYNVAQHFNDGQSIRVISGINLSMLLRVLNYPELSLDLLCEKALTGGKEGVINCEHKGETYAVKNAANY